jgi:hypothetical protein
MIRSAPFPVGTGELSLDVDLWMEQSTYGYASSILTVHYAGSTEPGWLVGAGGDPMFTNQDYMGWIAIVPGYDHIGICPASRMGLGCTDLPIPGFADAGVWFHVRWELCRDRSYVRVTDRESGALLLETTPPVAGDFTPAGYYQNVFVQLMAEGTEKAFDNVVVRSGCEH